MTHFPSFSEAAIERILELSADLQIRRRSTPNGSAAYKTFSAAIAAYGEVLGVLTTLQQEQDADATLGLLGSLSPSLKCGVLFS